MNSSGGKEISPSKISLIQAGKKDLALLAQFSKKMRRNNIKLLPFKERELFEKYRAYGEEPDKLNLFLLKYGKSIVGCAGYGQFSGLLNGKNITGVIANAAIVDPAFRKLFPSATVLLGRSYKDIVFGKKMFTLFVPLDEEMSLLYKKRPFKHFTYLYQFINPFIAKVKPTYKNFRIEINEISHFEKKETKAFFKKISPQYCFLMHSESDLLNWKYSGNAYYKFKILTATICGKLVGYIVVTKIGTDIYIVDITVDLECPSAILLPMLRSFDYYDTKCITRTIVGATHRDYIGVLQKAGFLCSWKRECLFFPGSLDFFKINNEELNSSDRSLYHFNGFLRHLY